MAEWTPRAEEMTSVPMPGTSAPAGTRTLAALVTAALTALSVLLGVAIGWTNRDGSSFSDTLSAVQWPVLVSTGLWVVMLCALTAGTAATPGQWVLGLGSDDADSGRPSGIQAVGKEVLLVLVTVATAGLGTLVMVALRNPAGQNVFDRIAGVQVVRRRGRTVPGEGAGFLSGLMQTQTQRKIGEGGYDGVTVANARVFGVDPARIEVHLDQGARLVVDRVYVLGRQPSAPRSHPGATPFLVPDEEKTTSKSHLALTPVRDGLQVTDLHSTNGVRVYLPNGQDYEIERGATVLVPVGATLTWGARRMEVRSV